ncbi:unnamed protein product [Vitrella brassicaformis CCMP3155]|uniref:DNA-directed RNA polymerase III subunit RPC6 n=2 Tax=Vitrella brassicaformis TaxID=1169539 RepID=A0A0G4EAQ1_VITBC|nr:unnamed protein product [Vitrella brassicaformis CCMP3155]|eukprot:CEL92516.1 unnamed protein product [Vitrella brassicaformis CCMP3155]
MRAELRSCSEGGAPGSSSTAMAATPDKKEAQQFLEFVKKHPHGASQGMLTAAGWEAERIAQIANWLCLQGRLQLMIGPDSKPSWKYRTAEEARKFADLAPEDVLVYQSIEKAGRRGIWTRDLKNQCNLQPHQIQKALKALEGRRLVKAVKSVQFKNRKVYMLFELEPDKEVSGGSWYRDGEFDEKLIESLRQHCEDMISSCGKATLSEIRQHLKTSGISKDDLPEEDIITVLRTLELEQKIVSFDDEGATIGDKIYQTTKWAQLEIYKEIPCASCPVFRDCTQGGGSRIGPENCEYYTKWLGLDRDVRQDDTAMQF